MSIEIMAWTSLIAGLATFAAVKALSWMPMSIRLMIWFLGTSLMGFAMNKLVYCYDPKMSAQAAQMALCVIMVSLIAMLVIAVYIAISLLLGKPMPI